MDHTNIELPSNRKFGLFFTLIFLIAAIYFYLYDHEILSYIFGLLVVTFLVISIYNPKVLAPLNIIWMRFGFLIGKIISPIVMGVIFFGIFTPLAIIMRLFGRDELNLRYKKNDSDWVKRKQGLQVTLFKNQF
tara:strand:+ start:151 stop:549 length:399 start_codon:yes stop_codon:yes gene_type:complete